MKKRNDKFVFVNRIIEELADSGRYFEIIKILEKIVDTTSATFPVECYSGEQGKAKFCVSGNELRLDARKLLDILNPKNFFIELYEEVDSFDTIIRYLRTRNDVFLHNFANTISHGEVPNSSIEDIRASLVLENLVSSIWGDFETWTVPKGWRKEAKDENVNFAPCLILMVKKENMRCE